MLICEWEDLIADGFEGNWTMPYAHIISWLLVNTTQFLDHTSLSEQSRLEFPDYTSPGVIDRCRGPRGLRAVRQDVTTKELGQVEEEDMALREAEC